MRLTSALIPAALLATLSLVGCNDEGDETATDTGGDTGEVTVDDNCDGVDDDADGSIDEDGTCEACDGEYDSFNHEAIEGTDEDDDGSIDEGFDENDNGTPDCQEDSNGHLRMFHFIIDPANTDADVDDDGVNDGVDVDITGGPDTDSDDIDDRYDASITGGTDANSNGVDDAAEAAGVMSQGYMLPVDVSLSGTGAAVNDVPIPTFASTGYADFPPTSYTVEITEVGNASNVYYQLPSTPVDKGVSYTGLFWGTYTDGATAGNNVISVVHEDDVSAPASGNMKINFVNTSYAIATANAGGAGINLDLWEIDTTNTQLEDNLAVGAFGSYHEVSDQGAAIGLDFDDDGVPTNLLTLPSAAELGACDLDGIPNSGDEFTDLPNFTIAMLDNPAFGTTSQVPVGGFLVYGENCPAPKVILPATR